LDLFKGNEYQKTLAIALSLSLLATILIMGGALFGFLYWRKAKLNQSGSSSQNQSILRSLGNRFSGNGYKTAQVVRLDNIPPNNYVNDNAFELQQYDNQTFENFDGYQNFTDFSGSREVGIDVGPAGNDVTVQYPPAELSKPKKLNNLTSVVAEALTANERAKQEAILRDLEEIESDEDRTNDEMDKLR